MISLRELGIEGPVHWNLPVARLYEEALRAHEGLLAATGPFAIETTPHTGRSPQDKYIVEEPSAAGEIDWGPVNQPIDAAFADAIVSDVASYLARQELFVQDLWACADPRYRLRVRVVTELAGHALFSRNLFIAPDEIPTDREPDLTPDFTVLHAPRLQLDAEKFGIRSETAILLDFSRRLVVIAGTLYAGEIKKSIFTALQYLLPLKGVATMHCSANEGTDGEVALFFGLSGTGKTTLSTDPTRTLIGDDEHGWTDTGIFNFEGGSYAKVINLSPTAEPDIYRATHQFGTVLENVVIDPETRSPQFDDDSLTENTRSAFPLSFIDRATTRGTGDHPRQIVFLTADAFGVLPPVAKLTVEQAMYYFLSGYTSKLAGTERDVDEPEATFSACFGSPFLPLHPVRYAELLGQRIREHAPSIWLVNTGWTGGPYGKGHRISIDLTRAIVRAIVEAKLEREQCVTESYFGLSIPIHCESVPEGVLNPKETWADSGEYERLAAKLAGDFRANFEQFVDRVDDSVRQAGP
ncbi:MAG: phosphoenolpyruvate carboxykinase (ATP) [Thermomicrobiales bacterium]